MAVSRKVIITCAITGGVHTPSMTPYLPISAEDIAKASLEAVEAGASIVHLHARDPATGKPSQDPELFKAFVPEISHRSDAVINITTGGSPLMDVEERLQPALQLKPEIASLNMGSMNFGLFPMADKISDFKNSWEEEFLIATKSTVFKNTYQDIEYILSSCAKNGTRFELECYDTSHLYNLAYFADKGIIKPPFFIQTVFGILGGIGSHPDDVSHMKRTADRLFGTDYIWSTLGAGSKQMSIAAFSAANGGHVRVGLEDSIWERPGELAKTNADQVRRARSIIEGLGLDVATPDEARELLKLKGSVKY
ncbi:MAG: 3-keto-5-aminohexanoate cleavage protein [Gammaproteobacteria bacterium]|uniref:3-keto-5-aminohexanoate cleavage protein n=1 Tax=Vreelandella venusta TaxID=44935 RepID=UPI004044B2EE|nr:3-keto-5-aminohexanoate cleavage protein [Gammaproteobacteria bacterium]